MHLTEKEIRSFPAGRDFDLLMAEYYGGHKWYKWQATNGFFAYTCCGLYKPGEQPKGSEECPSKPFDSVFPNNYEPQRYSSLISAAWILVRQLREQGYLFALHDNDNQINKNKYDVRFYKETHEVLQQGLRASATAETDMLAICRAALLLKLYEYDLAAKPLRRTSAV